MATASKVLLVEDSKFLRIASERALSKAGFFVITAGDGERALELADQIRPDIIVLDMMLPKISGLNVLKTLKKGAETKDIPILVLSSLPQTNEEKLIAEGATAYFQKSALELDKGADKLATAIAGVLSKLKHQKEVAARLEELAAKKAAGK